MVLPFESARGQTRRLGRMALTALLIGLGAASLAALPLGNPALAGNGNGGHGHDSGHGGGSGGGNGGGNGGGQGHGGGERSRDAKSGNAGRSGSETSGRTGAADAASEDASDDSMAPGNLGKLNGFFHASSTGLANASPNSSIGRISHIFKDALSDFAEAGATPSDPNAPPPSGPSVDGLGAILAGATNKTVTSTQVRAIIDRLAQENPDDASLAGLAGSIDDATCQDIADAANAANADQSTAESGDGSDDSADTASADASAGDSGTDETAVTTTTTN